MPACRPTRFPTTPGPARNRSTICIYWRYGEYAGIGPGAHGRLLIDGKRHATAAEKLPFDWQKKRRCRAATAWPPTTSSPGKKKATNCW